MFLHLIIPAINEAKNLRALLPYLKRELGVNGKIIVADGGSTDASRRVCDELAVTFFASPQAGRGPQMNAAVMAYPDADLYYFLHADAQPPPGFYQDILNWTSAGFPVGCYRYTFDSSNPLLKINAFCTRFDALHCRGGDQSLYVTKAVYEELGGFCPQMRIMEDYDIIERAQARYPFKIMPRSLTVSARKYRLNNYFRVQLANLIVFRMYRKGASQEAMVRTYRRWLRT
ncbi:MAG: glycosyltransferase [Bacteroidota bacterium]